MIKTLKNLLKQDKGRMVVVAKKIVSPSLEVGENEA